MLFSLLSVSVMLAAASQGVLLTPDAPAMNATAPAAFKVKLETTKGDVMIVPKGTPHWFKEVSGTVLYYVVKVR